MNDQLLDEQSVIGAILVDPRSLSIAAELLTPEDFSLDSDRALFRAALSLEREGKPIDPVVLRNQVLKAGGTVSVEYMLQLIDLTPTAANVREYAEQVKDHSLRQRIISESQNAIDRAKQMEAPTEILADLVDHAEQLQQGCAGELIDPNEAASRFLDHRIAVESGKSQAYVATGFQNLDEILGGGLLAGGMYILAGRPGMGKTTLAINIADKVAQNRNEVLFVSLEMDVEQVQAKRYARVAGIPGNKLLMGHLNEQEQDRLAQAMEEVSKLPVMINKRGSADMDKIESMARSVKDVYKRQDPYTARRRTFRPPHPEEAGASGGGHTGIRR